MSATEQLRPCRSGDLDELLAIEAACFTTDRQALAGLLA